MNDLTEYKFHELNPDSDEGEFLEIIQHGYRCSGIIILQIESDFEDFLTEPSVDHGLNAINQLTQAEDFCV